MSTKENIAEATNKAIELPTAVLVLAQLSKVSPAQFAKLFYDDASNAAYRADVAGEMIRAKIVKAHAEEVKASK